MIKLLTILSIFISNTLASNTPNSESSSGGALHIRHFHKFSSKLKSISELSLSREHEHTSSKTASFGLRYRIHTNIKLSTYYKFAQGLRHQDDWIKEQGSWLWRDSSSRSENIFGLSASIKEILNSNIFELRSTLERNFYNDHNLLKLRPGVTHLFMKDGSPFLNAFLQYEMYLPLNFHEETIYKHGVYTGLLYHYNSTVKPGIFFKIIKSKWTNSSEAIKRNVPTYSLEDTSKVFGLNINLYY